MPRHTLFEGVGNTCVCGGFLWGPQGPLEDVGLQILKSFDMTRGSSSYNFLKMTGLFLFFKR